MSPYLICVVTNIEPVLTKRFAQKYLQEAIDATINNLFSANETAIRNMTKPKF